MLPFDPAQIVLNCALTRFETLSLFSIVMSLLKLWPRAAMQVPLPVDPSSGQLWHCLCLFVAQEPFIQMSRLNPL